MKEISLKLYRLFSSSALAKATSFLTLAQIISAGTNFLLLSIFTKYLPPEEFGKISLIWVFVTVVTIVVDSGMNTAFSIKFYKTTSEEQAKNVFIIFSYYLIILGLVFALFRYTPVFFQKLLRVEVSIHNLNIIFLLILFMLFGNFYTNIPKL